MTRTCALAACAAGFIATFSAAAVADQAAVVIGTAVYEDHDDLIGPIAAARTLSKSLQSRNIAVDLIENATTDDFSTLLVKAEEVTIFFSGYATSLDGQTYLLPSDVSPRDEAALREKAVPIDTLLSGIEAETITLIVDRCHNGTTDLPGGGVIAGIDQDNLSLVLEAPLGEPCASSNAADIGAIVARSLATTDDSLINVLADLSATSTSVLWMTPRAEALDDAALARNLDVVQNDSIVISAAVRPVNVARAVAPVISNPSGGEIVGGGLTIFAALPAPASQPTPDGLPEPSIIVGIIESEADEFDQIDGDGPGTLAGSELSITDPAARATLREEQPEFFATLLQTGAFDPAPAELPREIQSELSRLNCYTAGIDGIWGAGSRRSVGRYIQASGQQIDGDAPSIGLFRILMAADEVRCPDAAPVQRVATQPQTTRRATQTRQTAPAPRTAPAAAPQPAPPAQQQPSERRINRQTGLIGVVR
ncbi:caspase family protein [Aestuariibius insulae]|uniref:caspase family protein n=1 Tax=Aestuariibius insulae TaxID=2058287 RepID=UPI00345EC1B1